MSQKRAGAFVAIAGQYPPYIPPPPGYGPYGGMGPYPGLPYGPIGPYGPPFIPPYPAPFVRPFRERRNRDVVVNSTLVANQTITAGATAQQILVGSVTSNKGSISSGSLVIPCKGTYIVGLTATVTRSSTSDPGDVLFTVSGGNATVTIAGGNVATSGTQVFSGTATITFNSHNGGTITIYASNSTTGAGDAVLTNGTLYATKQ